MNTGIKAKNTWEVTVGNIGSVFLNGDGFKARLRYAEYVRLSKSGHGRAAGESVTLWKNGEPHLEYTGPMDFAE